jgi:hypothetical protein
MASKPHKGRHIAAVAQPVAPQQVQLSASDHLQLVRLEHDADLQRVRLQLARAHDRAVRLEITQAAQAAADGLRRAEEALRAAAKQQRSFAEALADRYAFAWSTHAYDPDTGVVRRVAEE